MLPPSASAPPPATSPALPAVELSKNEMLPLPYPGQGQQSAPPAASSPALAAVELLKKVVLPPSTLVMLVLAAVVLLKKLVVLPASFLILCVVPELFTMP